MRGSQRGRRSRTRDGVAHSALPGRPGMKDLEPVFRPEITLTMRFMV